MISARVPRLKVVALALMASLVAACGGGDGAGASSVQQIGPPGGVGNSAPTIQGQPSSSVLAGQSYSFQPSASDADQDRLTFAVTNLPRWAAFDTVSGRLSGTPAAADVATYSNITITVSDGRASASIGPFAIAVTETGAGVATLSWTPPTQNSDGSALEDLAGYQISYGRSADDLGQSISVTNASVSTYVVENLTTGTWFFAVSAVNARGISSPLSNVASKTIT